MNKSVITGPGYDTPITSYSPEGRVLQVEYATLAVANSFTIIGMRGKDSVVLAVDKIIMSSLYEPDADGRIVSLERNIGMAMAGLTSDGHAVADIARQEAANFRMNYNRVIPLRDLCERIASYMHAATLNGLNRPFGLSVILASWEASEGPELYKIEPCGSFLGYYACACGRAKPQADQEFDKLENLSGMGTEELVKAAAEIIYKGHYDWQNRDFLFEMGIVGKDTRGLNLINPPVLTEIARAAGAEAAANETSSSDEAFF
ncbi:hypothetical protein KR059_011857 [Drosophila kikkawai]|nr:hypothetical protein KR059_011857 [Drosophila kikkawai]